MNEFNQEQTLRQNFDQLLLNIRTYLLIVENISNSFEGRMGWKEFKFCFKLATSQIVSNNSITFYFVIVFSEPFCTLKWIIKTEKST